MTTEEAHTIGSDAEMIKKKEDKGWAEASVGSSQGPVIDRHPIRGSGSPWEDQLCRSLLQYDTARTVSLVIDLGASDPLWADQIALCGGFRYKVVILVPSVQLHGAFHLPHKLAR